MFDPFTPTPRDFIQNIKLINKKKKMQQLREKKSQLGFPCHMLVIKINGALGVVLVVQEQSMNNFQSHAECYPKAL